ncbi:MAG: hypothetical protein JWR08_729 [Enterovirga sp.]|jgi:hypothetical protein|nr:hypothetical protein [Enterovirga sp.]
MARYFLNVRTSAGELIRDPEGDEAECPGAAREQAILTAADLIANFRGLDWRGCSFEVTDEAGHLVFTLPFSAAPHPRAV